MDRKKRLETLSFQTVWLKFGGPEGARTLDLLNAIQALSQAELQAHVLKYSVVKVIVKA